MATESKRSSEPEQLQLGDSVVDRRDFDDANSLFDVDHRNYIAYKEYYTELRRSELENLMRTIVGDSAYQEFQDLGRFGAHFTPDGWRTSRVNLHNVARALSDVGFLLWLDSTRRILDINADARGRGWGQREQSLLRILNDTVRWTKRMYIGQWRRDESKLWPASKDHTLAFYAFGGEQEPAPVTPKPSTPRPLPTTEQARLRLDAIRTPGATPATVAAVVAPTAPPLNLFRPQWPRPPLHPPAQPQQKLVAMPRAGIERCAEATAGADDISGSLCLTNLMYDFGRRIVYGLPQVMYGGTFGVEVACWRVLREASAQTGALAMPLDGFSRVAGYQLNRYFEQLREETRDSSSSSLPISESCLPLKPAEIKNELRYRNEDVWHEPTLEGQNVITAFEKLLSVINPSSLPTGDAKAQAAEANGEIKKFAGVFAEEMQSKQAVSTSDPESLLAYLIPDETAEEVRWVLAGTESMDWERVKPAPSATVAAIGGPIPQVLGDDWIDRFVEESARRDAKAAVRKINVEVAAEIAKKEVKAMDVDTEIKDELKRSEPLAGGASAAPGPSAALLREQANYPRAIFSRLVREEAEAKGKRDLPGFVQRQGVRFEHSDLDRLHQELDAVRRTDQQLQFEINQTLKRLDEKHKKKAKDQTAAWREAQKAAREAQKEAEKEIERTRKLKDIEEKTEEERKKHEENLQKIKDEAKKKKVKKAEEFKAIAKKKANAVGHQKEEKKLKDEMKAIDEEVAAQLKAEKDDWHDFQEEKKKEAKEVKLKEYKKQADDRVAKGIANKEENKKKVQRGLEHRQELKEMADDHKQRVKDIERAEREEKEVDALQIKRDFGLKQIKKKEERLKKLKSLAQPKSKPKPKAKEKPKPKPKAKEKPKQKQGGSDSKEGRESKEREEKKRDEVDEVDEVDETDETDEKHQKGEDGETTDEGADVRRIAEEDDDYEIIAETEQERARQSLENRSGWDVHRDED